MINTYQKIIQSVINKNLYKVICFQNHLENLFFPYNIVTGIYYNRNVFFSMIFLFYLSMIIENGKKITHYYNKTNSTANPIIIHHLIKVNNNKTKCFAVKKNK